MNSHRFAALLCLPLVACAAQQRGAAHAQPSTATSMPAATAVEEPRTPHGYCRNVAVLVFEGVELLDFAGPVEVFTNARGWDEPLRVYSVGAERRAIRSLNELAIVPDYSIDDCPAPDILVIPGGEVRCLEPEHPLGRFVAERAPQAEIVFSVCNGVFALS